MKEKEDTFTALLARVEAQWTPGEKQQIQILKNISLWTAHLCDQLDDLIELVQEQVDLLRRHLKDGEEWKR